jgi:hypothetical protein
MGRFDILSMQQFLGDFWGIFASRTVAVATLHF